MHFAAIVEQRPKHWYVYLPALATEGPVSELADAQARAREWVATATGLPAADVLISLSHAVPGSALVPVPPTEADVRHKGTWVPAQHIGWLREWSGSWLPLVEYAADGATWKRAVQPSCFRLPGLTVPDGPASAPRPVLSRA